MVTNAERLYASILMLVTATGFAYFVANMASLISNEDSAIANFQQKVRSISAFMRYRNVPSDVQKKVRVCHSH